MRHVVNVQTWVAAAWLACAAPAATAQYPGWSQSGSLYIITTPDGANLPTGTMEKDFPLLVRLNSAFFDFSQARADGADLRFSSDTGTPLAYQIEEWDAPNGSATVWVRVPVIQGNEQQEIHLHWGKADAVSESNGAAVFNASNGYLSVWHMNGPVKDEVGTLQSVDSGTTPATGIIGKARHLAGNQGISGGTVITNYPTGAHPHSSEAWFRAEQSDGRVLGWGNEHAQGKVVMQFQSPPHVQMDCYFSNGNVASTGRMALNEWNHVLHTYQSGESRIYVNGVLEATTQSPRSPLAIQRPARLWLGGWYDNYDFHGDLDEVRISNVVRSPEWARLQYENQRQFPTLVGGLVPPGNAFGVSPASITVPEGQARTFSAGAGGAHKVVWRLKRDDHESIVATDCFNYTFSAGRVTTNSTATLTFQAIYAGEVRTQVIPIAVTEDIPEPVFTLTAPSSWDGRKTIEVVPQIANLADLNAKGVGDLTIRWKVANLATLHEVVPGKLRLERAQNSGQITVTAAISNGGAPTTHSIAIAVTEPPGDPWVPRVPDREEQPMDGQFYARDDQNAGTLFYNGRLKSAAEAVFVRIYADETLVQTITAPPAADLSYALSARLKPGLIHYRFEGGTRSGGRETVFHTATNLVCGDAYLIQGQSNALATDTGEKSPPATHEWIRSYGRPPENPNDAPGNRWCLPVWKSPNGEPAELGWWGMELAKRLVASQKLPIFLINGAVGGTRIDQHQRNASNPTDPNTIYGRTLWRIQQARLTHGIRGILWHQGENNQGAAGPSGDFDWKDYEDYFVTLAAAWKRDFPNVQHLYVFQIWPDACSMGGRTGAGDQIREIQRHLPRLHSHLSVMSTLGIQPPGGCHYPLAGWSEFARLIQPLIERDNYGGKFPESITPPNLQRARFTSPAHDAIALEFDQPILWNERLIGEFYLNGEKDQVAAGSLNGNILTLRLKAPSAATRITYLKESAWSQDRLLFGVNHIAALSFCDVPLE